MKFILQQAHTAGDIKHDLQRRGEQGVLQQMVWPLLRPDLIIMESVWVLHEKAEDTETV